jgi:hypothetical protein
MLDMPSPGVVANSGITPSTINY